MSVKMFTRTPSRILNSIAYCFSVVQFTKRKIVKMGEPPVKRLKLERSDDSDKENTPPIERNSTRKRKIPLKKQFGKCVLNGMPYDILENIFKHLSLEELLNLSFVSTAMKDNVERYFAYRYKYFHFAALSVNRPGPISRVLAKLVVLRFGHLMQTIQIPLKSFQPVSSVQIVRYIMTNCTNYKTITIIR